MNQSYNRFFKILKDKANKDDGKVTVKKEKNKQARFVYIIVQHTLSNVEVLKVFSNLLDVKAFMDNKIKTLNIININKIKTVIKSINFVDKKNNEINISYFKERVL